MVFLSMTHYMLPNNSIQFNNLFIPKYTRYNKGILNGFNPYSAPLNWYQLRNFLSQSNLGDVGPCAICALGFLSMNFCKNSTIPQAGIDPQAQSHISYEACTLPPTPSHYSRILFQTYKPTKKQFMPFYALPKNYLFNFNKYQKKMFSSILIKNSTKKTVHFRIKLFYIEEKLLTEFQSD